MKNTNEKYQSTYTYRGLATPLHFNKGDVVYVEKLENSPNMIVKDILFDYYSSDENEFNIEKKNKLVGIRCWWFSTTNHYCEETFNTKDLVLIEEQID